MESQKIIHDLEVFAAEIRLETVRISASLGFDLAGDVLSLADVMAVLYGDVMRTDPNNKAWKDRDWFVLSAGHCAPVLYAVLHLKGYLENYGRYAERVYADGEETRHMGLCEPGFKITKDYDINLPFWKFSMNADRDIENGVEFTTGSPGHGLSQAAGAALGNRIQGRNNRVYAVISGNEADSGQLWEAAQFAAHYKLDHLICLVDSNSVHKNMLDCGKGIGAKFDAFGWNVIDVADGNDIEQIYDALMTAKKVKGQPVCIVLSTTAGKEVPLKESNENHSERMTKEQLTELISACESNLAAVRAK